MLNDAEQAANASAATKVADVEARLAVQTGTVADLNRQVTQIDTAIEQTTAHGRGKAADIP